MMNEYEDKLANFCGVDDIGDVSDGFHTFNQLYHQRAVLFACIVNANPQKSWKTKRHEDGELCFGGGWFLVTVETPEGAYGYHYADKYWELFECAEIERAKHWDGYTEDDVGRLLSLNRHGVDAEPVRHGRWIEPDERDISTACICSNCNWHGHVLEDDVMGMNFCPNCGAKMDKGGE